MSYLLVDLGWVDFDSGFPPSCLLAKPLLPNSHQPKSESGREWNTQNPGQPSPRADGTACTLSCQPQLTNNLLEKLNDVAVNIIQENKANVTLW